MGINGRYEFVDIHISKQTIEEVVCMGIYDRIMKVFIDRHPRALTQFVWNLWGRSGPTTRHWSEPKSHG